VAFAGIAAINSNFVDLTIEWQRNLKRCGLTSLTMKQALNHRRPISGKVEAKGITNRVKTLLPFIEAIRKHNSLVVGAAVDVEAFNALPSEDRRSLENNPHYMAFVRVLVEAADIVNNGDKLTCICDDDEKTAYGMNELYRMVRRHHSDARQKLALSFADDSAWDVLQAADLVSSLMRMEGGYRLKGQEYDYRDLFISLTSPQPGDKLSIFRAGFFGSQELKSLSQDYRKLRAKNAEDGISQELRLIDVPRLPDSRGCR
jgi:hypothetical protein